jgi:hypothetical protein
VRDEDRRDVDLVVETAQPVTELLAHLGVERAERLVQEQHLGLDRERPGQRHALALAARELARVAMGEPLKLDQVHEVLDAVLDLVARDLANAKAERDVVPDRHVLEGRVVLEHEPDAALLDGLGGDVAVGDRHVAGVELLEPRDRAQQRRLAAPAGAEQGRQRAVADLHRDSIEGREVPEPLGRVLHDDAHTDSSLGLNRFMSSSVATARIASTTAAA